MLYTWVICLLVSSPIDLSKFTFILTPLVSVRLASFGQCEAKPMATKANCLTKGKPKVWTVLYLKFRKSISGCAVYQKDKARECRGSEHFWENGQKHVHIQRPLLQQQYEYDYIIQIVSASRASICHFPAQPCSHPMGDLNCFIFFYGTRLNHGTDQQSNSISARFTYTGT